MASAFTHALVAGTVVSVFPMKRKTWLLVLFAMLFAAMPDVDVLAFRFGIPYENVFGHRGITHSLFFAFCWGVLWAYVFTKWLGWKSGWRLVVLFFVVTASHGLLDALTTGGKGIAFFAPFNNDRYFLPWRIIRVSPINIQDFFGEWGKRVMLSEFKIVWIPCLIILFIQFVIGHVRKLVLKTS